VRSAGALSIVVGVWLAEAVCAWAAEPDGQAGPERVWVYRVVDEQGHPVAGARLECHCGTSAVSDPTGEARLSVPVRYLGFTVSVTRGDLRSCYNTPAEAKPLVLRALGRLHGTALRPDSAPAVGHHVAAYHQDCGFDTHADVGPDGRFELLMPQGGDASVSLLPPEAAPEDWRGQRADLYLVGLEGPDTRLDFGPAPGTASLTIRTARSKDDQLWLYRGECAADDLAFLLSWGPFVLSLAESPPPPVLRLQGLAAGRYCAVQGDPLLAAGKSRERPRLRAVDLAAGAVVEIDLGR
jgi:hypothetical protein